MSESFCVNPNATCLYKQSMVVVCAVIIDSLGLSYGAEDRRAQEFVLVASTMPKKASKRNLSGPELTAAIAEKVFG